MNTLKKNGQGARSGSWDVTNDNSNGPSRLSSQRSHSYGDNSSHGTVPMTLYDYVATDARMVSIKKGTVVKIVDMKTYSDWTKVEVEGRVGYFPRNYLFIPESVALAGGYMENGEKRRGEEEWKGGGKKGECLCVLF